MHGDLLIVCDAGHSRIVVCNKTGELVRIWGEHGRGDGEFLDPRGVAVGAAGDVCVSDYIRDVIQVRSVFGACCALFVCAMF